MFCALDAKRRYSGREFRPGLDNKEREGPCWEAENPGELYARLAVRENATWMNGKLVYVATLFLHLRPRTSCASAVLPLYFLQSLSIPSLLLIYCHPYSNLWLQSTLLILPLHHHHPHHHHHALQNPPLYLFRRPPPPSLQQNPVLHPHPIKMAPHLESGPGLT